MQASEVAARARGRMAPTDISNPQYFHKVVDCQWACPAHTPVPEYIRLIAAGRYDDAYMINWKSNVFPGVLGRTCDRPCEPACRRGRVEEEPVAICRLKRVAADFKDDIRHRLPQGPFEKNGKRIACIGCGPASLTVARDLAPEISRAMLFYGLPNDWREVVDDLDCDAVHLYNRSTTQAAVKAITEAGLPLRVYTITDPKRAQELRAWGVQSVFTDRPDLIRD